MAINTGSQPGSDILAATAIRRYQLAIGDRDTSFLQHPTLRYGWLDETGFLQALAEEVPVVGFGLNMTASEAEGAEADELVPSGTSYTITPARRTGKMTVSGLYRILDGVAVPDYEILGAAMILGGERRLMADLGALFPSITSQVGATGVALSWETIRSAVASNHSYGSRGVQVALLEDKQWSDLSANALTLGGAVQVAPETQSFLGGSRGYSYKGRFLNGDLDVFVADGNVVTTVNVGADYSGCVFGPEAFGIRTVAPKPDMAAMILMQMGWLRAELDRDASVDATEVVVVGYHGAQIAQNRAATEVISAV